MPTTVTTTMYKCNTCGKLYATTALASSCEGVHKSITKTENPKFNIDGASKPYPEYVTVVFSDNKKLIYKQASIN